MTIVKVFKMHILLIFSCLFIPSKATSEFSILYSPSSLDFKGNENLNTDNLIDVLSASLGYSVQESSNWHGLYVNDPFNVPQSLITFIIDGVKHIHLKNAKSYPLIGNSAHESLNALSTLSEENDSRMIDVDLNQGVDGLQTYSDVLGDFHIPIIFKSKTNNLKPDLHSEDKLFLQQIAVINLLYDKIANKEFKPKLDLITIRISLESLRNAHGEKSPAFSEAIKLLSNTVENFMLTSRRAYKDDLLFAVITNDPESYERIKRQATKDEIDPVKLNLATYYSDDYPVIFNIILWFGVVMAFALLAISYTIATMDPGRDSIIYRMTSTRMKKDN